MDTITLTWINSLILVPSVAVILWNIVILRREGERHAAVLRDMAEAQRGMLEALRLLTERIR